MTPNPYAPGTPAAAQPLAACPACGRPWLYGLTWQHRTTCPHYEPDSATAMADYTAHQGTRPATPTELEMIRNDYQQPEDESHSLGVRFHHSGIHQRTVVLLDGDGRCIGPADRRDP